MSLFSSPSTAVRILGLKVPNFTIGEKPINGFSRNVQLEFDERQYLEQISQINHYDQFKTIRLEGRGLSFKDAFVETKRSLPHEPFYYLDVAKLRNTTEQFIREFQERVQAVFPNTFLSYALKANPLPEIIRIIADAGVEAFDCASLGEVHRIHHLVPSAKKYLNNCAPRKSHVMGSSLRGVTQFTVDEANEIGNVMKFYRGNINDLLVAIRFKADKSGAVIDLSEYYGAKVSGAIALLDVIDGYGLQTGVTMHVGSQNESPMAHVESFELMADELRKENKTVDLFNLGGGIPVFQDNEYRQNAKTAEQYLRILSESVVKNIRDIMNPDGSVFLEPGRGLIAPAVDLAVPILSLKNNGKIPELRIADGIFNSFSDAVIHGWKYPIRVLDAEGNEVKGKKTKFVLKGQSCDGGDVVTYKNGEEKILHIELPERIRPDHSIWVPNAGAYMSSQASDFNGFGMHPYIFYNS